MFSTQPITEDLHALLMGDSEILKIELPQGENSYYNYRCPIFSLMMCDPVSVSPCKHNFERIAIETWRDTKQEQEQKASCPCCRGSIEKITVNRPLKENIRQFLITTQEQLKRGKPNDASARKICHLIENFLKYGHNEAILQSRFSRFCSNLANRDIRGVAQESMEASQESLKICRIS